MHFNYEIDKLLDIITCITTRIAVGQLFKSTYVKYERK
ncbi:MAG: hypothetical protein ACI8RA_001733 [Chlamydiales bacterium]|jgi:hypothetical protein